MARNKVSKLVIGSAQFGMKYGIAHTGSRVSSESVFDILRAAKKLGIDTIDTAKAYGDSEARIGQYVARCEDDSWKIITKVTKDARSIRDQVTNSRESLKTVPFIVLAHSSSDYFDRSFRSQLHDLKENEGVSKVGLSVYSVEEAHRLASVDSPDVVQVPMNILDTKFYRSGILEEMKESNIEVHVRSVFLQGLFYLTDKQINKVFPDVLSTIRCLRKISNEAGVTLPQLSLLWVSSLDNIDKIVIGVDNKDQLFTQVKTLDEKIEDDIFERAINLKYENNSVLNPMSWNI